MLWSLDPLLKRAKGCVIFCNFFRGECREGWIRLIHDKTMRTSASASPEAVRWRADISKRGVSAIFAFSDWFVPRGLEVPKTGRWE